MSTATEVDAGEMTFTEIVEAMDFHIGCENPQHKDYRNYHSGDAEWMHNGRRPCCSHPISHMICDKWREALRTGEGTVTCLQCGASSSAKAWFAAAEWVKL